MQQQSKLKEVTKLCGSGFPVDVWYKNQIQRSKNHKINFNNLKAVTKKRKIIIEKLLLFCHEILPECPRTTIHLAVSYLDRLLGQGVKFVLEDMDLNFVTFMKLAYLIDGNQEMDVHDVIDLTPSDKRRLMDREYSILQGIDYELNKITEAHFLEYFLLIGVVSRQEQHDLLMQANTSNWKVISRNLTECVDVFCDIILQFGWRENPLVTACAIIALARESIGVFPRWPDHLVSLTHQTWTPDCEELYSNIRLVINIPTCRQQPALKDQKNDSPQGVFDLIKPQEEEKEESPPKNKKARKE